MIPVDQTITDFITGDCYRACVASIFEIPIEGIPNFMEDGVEKFYEYLDAWTLKIGLRAIDITLNDPAVVEDCYVIAAGESPRNKDFKHGVVWLNGKVVHDPHPEKTGIVGEPTSVTVFVIMNPALLPGTEYIADFKLAKGVR